MDLKLNLQSGILSDESIQQLCTDLCQTLNYETDSNAVLSNEEVELGSKGEASIIGEVILTLLSSGSVVALFNVIKSYINRDSNLSIEITGPKGSIVKIDATNIKSEELNNTISELKSIL